jgi:hypothetical protein
MGENAMTKLEGLLSKKGRVEHIDSDGLKKEKQERQ